MLPNPNLEAYKLVNDRPDGDCAPGTKLKIGSFTVLRIVSNNFTKTPPLPSSIRP